MAGSTRNARWCVINCEVKIINNNWLRFGRAEIPCKILLFNFNKRL
jgi:hypothetical protein